MGGGGGGGVYYKLGKKVVVLNETVTTYLRKADIVLGNYTLDYSTLR